MGGGGAEGDRTPYLLNAIEALYQMSYDPDTAERLRPVTMPLFWFKQCHCEGSGAERASGQPLALGGYAASALAGRALSTRSFNGNIK